MPIEQPLTIKKEEGKVYDPLPENIYQVELLDVSSKETETYDSKLSKGAVKEYETVLTFQYTLLAGKNKEGESLRGRNVWDNFVPASLYIGKNGKNKLYKIVESLLGRELTPEEEAMGIDHDFLNDLIGKQMRIGTKNNASKKTDAIYTNADTYYPSENDLEPLSEKERDEATVKNKKDDEVRVESVEEEDLSDSVPF
jgi:hypothetical protein